MQRCYSTLIALAVIATTSFAGLTPAEKAGGWRMLFDGESWAGWRSYHQEKPPGAGVEDRGWDAARRRGRGRGDIVTDGEFGDFELSIEFKVSKGANSGIIYRASEKYDYPWQTGPEYQILDDEGTHEGGIDTHSVAACYDIYVPSPDKVTKPAGEWNEARIRIRDGIVQHFLNGVKVVEYDMKSPEWKEKIAASKFAGYEGFGLQPRGHISLQDHGNDVWYRDIKVRELDKPLPDQVTLFDGEDFDGWNVYTQTQAWDGPTTWTVRDGEIVCMGQPAGYIKTNDTFDNYVLMLRWRFMPDRAGNSGALLRVIGEDKCWPNCIEAQLQSGNAGDFWNISGETIEMARPNGRNGKKSHEAERPVGEWNEYEIVCEGGKITLFVNGEQVNEAAGCPERAGAIALQSEGAEIHFKDIRLSPIE